MIGWRARLGFLVPPGNPTVEPEMMALAPEGVTVHFNRMVARGLPGAPDGQSERNRMMIDNIDASIEMLALVHPDVIVIAHTATSITSAAKTKPSCWSGWKNRPGPASLPPSARCCGRWSA